LKHFHYFLSGQPLFAGSLANGFRKNFLYGLFGNAGNDFFQVFFGVDISLHSEKNYVVISFHYTISGFRIAGDNNWNSRNYSGKAGIFLCK
jgi:hypothetical protein